MDCTAACSKWGIAVILLAVLAVLLWAFLPRPKGEEDVDKGGDEGFVPTNILQNPSFELDFEGTWQNNSFWMERVSEDTAHGNFSLKAWHRDRSTEGPSQYLNMSKGDRFEFSGYVKILNDVSGQLYQPIAVLLQFRWADENALGSYEVVYRGKSRSANGWMLLNGSFQAPMRDFSSCRFTIRGPQAGVDFLVDGLAMDTVPENVKWRAEAYTSIDAHRKSNINFVFTVPPKIPRETVDIQVRLKKHRFEFGVRSNDVDYRREQYQSYRALVFSWFNTVTINSINWKYNAGNETNPDYSKALSAIDVIRANGLKVRAHCIHRDTPDNIPDWVTSLNGGQELRDVVNFHIEQMVNLTRGKLFHWCVMNEHLQGLWYEEKLLDPDITKSIFRHYKKQNPDAKAFLNDFTGVTAGGNTQAMYDMLMEYKAEGVPIDGLGIQGHTKNFTMPDPTLMKRRLDYLGKTGVELFMTEFDLAWPDVVQRADWLEDAFRTFFAHPALQGAAVWSLLDTETDVNKELFAEANFTMLEPGQRLGCLIKKEWSTNITRNLADGLSFRVRGFQGDYQVVVRRSGIPVQVVNFTLGPNDAEQRITVTDSNEPVEVLETPDYLPVCRSHRGQASLGSQATTATDTTITCITVRSAASGGKEGDEASATCGAGELIMTGCASLHVNKEWTKRGERITFKNDTATCIAYNGRNSPAGVKAEARCCKLSGLTCDYRVAGPSSAFQGAQSEARCHGDAQPLGCTSYSQYPDMDGAYADTTENSCIAQSGDPVFNKPDERSGSTVSAACCSAPKLVCTRVTSGESTLGQGDNTYARCPPDQVMVSCTHWAGSGKSGGATILSVGGEDMCVTYMGANLPARSHGTMATATCCVSGA